MRVRLRTAGDSRSCNARFEVGAEGTRPVRGQELVTGLCLRPGVMVRFVFHEDDAQAESWRRGSEHPLPANGQIPFSSAARAPVLQIQAPGQPPLVHMFLLTRVRAFGEAAAAFS